MQRDKVTYPIIKKYRSFFFWQECRFCHKEFKREDGFSILDIKRCRATNENPYFTSYCCSKCSSSIDEVQKLLDANNPVKFFDEVRKKRFEEEITK